MIGGNVTAILQTKTTSKNAFGERESVWNDVETLTGFLDYTGGDGSYKNALKGSIEETSHIFVCDYVSLNVTPTQSRLIVNDKIYDVLMIDDPMTLHKHLEIFLKYNEVV